MGGYGCTGNWPDYNAWLQNAWGAGEEFWSSCGCCGYSVGFVFGQNPPYYLDDFATIYPKFFGLPTVVSNSSVTAGSNVVTVPTTLGLQAGQFIQAPGILPPGSIISSVTSGTTFTLSAAVGASAADFPLTTYRAAPIPIAVVAMYMQLAYASLVQERWQEQWYVAMGWFIAHYLTLYARSDSSEVFETLQTAIHGEAPVGATPGSVYALSSTPPGGVLQALTRNGLFQTPGVDYTLAGTALTLTLATSPGDLLYATWPVQTALLVPSQSTGATIAAQGLAGGIQTSKSVGDVSVAYQPLAALEDWAQWNLTLYGQQLATAARVIGAGPLVIW
jgi:hypothetical protein